MDLTDKQIKEIVCYGTLEGELICDMVVQEAFTPHLDWAISMAFELLDRETLIDGVKAKDILWGRLRLLSNVSNVKVNNDGKEIR